MVLYVASVLMYFNVMHGFMEDGRFECFNLGDSKLNIRMFSLLWENKENMRPLVGTSQMLMGAHAE